MIEKIAIALCNARRKRADIGLITSLDVLIPEAKKDYLDDAKTCIEEMREPTDKMILGWQDAQTCRDTYFDNDCYKAMIDAALKEE